MNKPERLYKYGAFGEYSLVNLQNQQLYFSKPINFNDPFDCAVGCTFEQVSPNDLMMLHKRDLGKSENIDGFKRKFGSSPNRRYSEHIQLMIKELFDSLKSVALYKAGVSCFSESPREILMWSHYSDRHKGFCLEFDTSYEPFKGARKVKYRKTIPHVNSSALLLNHDFEQVWKILTTKYKSWKYEKEWRCLNTEGDVLIKYPPEALTGVYFGSKMFSAQKEIIKQIVISQNPNIKFHNGSLSDEKYIVDFE